MRRLWRENSLTIVFLVLFVGAVAGQALLWLLSNSLVLVMATIWLGSWFAQAVTGWSDHNSDQLVHGEPELSLWQFV